MSRELCMCRISWNTDWLYSLSVSRGQCVSSLHLSPLSFHSDVSLELWNYSGGSNEDILSVPWQSSACLFCLPLYPTPVLTALFNVEQSSGSSVFFSLTEEGARVQRADSDWDDCDLIKMWPCAKAGLLLLFKHLVRGVRYYKQDKVLMIISHVVTHQYHFLCILNC